MMSARPLLTIAVPTYNGSSTICNMLDILLPQVNDKVEVLISDNCSTDETQEIIKRYMKNYLFIRYVRNKENIYADGNFLQCMRMARGKFTLLISDDDIIVEGGVEKICSFLEENPTITLAYMYTVGFNDRYEGIDKCKFFSVYSRKPERNLVTQNKHEFFEYVGRQWGFTSSFVWSTDRCKAIKNPEQYFNTYWLQSYIHILCSDKPSDLLGIIDGPCIAAGSYGIIGNYDSAKIEAVYYKKMLDFAVSQGRYDRKQLEKFWVWKVCYLTSRAVIKERAIGKNITSVKILWKTMRRYPYAWVHLFPFILIPSPVCSWLMKWVRKLQGRNFISYVNRPTEGD